MDRKAILAKLLPLLMDLKPNLKVESVTEDVRLRDDLGVDSITMLLMALRIEQEFGIRLENIQPNQMVLVGDVCAYIESRMKK